MPVDEHLHTFSESIIQNALSGVLGAILQLLVFSPWVTRYLSLTFIKNLCLAIYRVGMEAC